MKARFAASRNPRFTIRPWRRRKKPLATRNPARHFPALAKGVLAQLVERRNGIAEVRGSNPLGSTFIVVVICMK